jgi:hypothetical protein
VVCLSHGAKAPQVKRRAHERLAEEVADAELRKLADLDRVRPVENSLAELQWLAGLSRLWLEQMAQMVNQLEYEIRYEGKLHGEQLRAEVGLLERAMDRCYQINATIARLNLDERLVAIEERKADMILSAFGAALVKAGMMDGDTQALAYGEFSRRLKVIAGAVELESA